MRRLRESSENISAVLKTVGIDTVFREMKTGCERWYWNVALLWRASRIISYSPITSNKNKLGTLGAYHQIFAVSCSSLLLNQQYQNSISDVFTNWNDGSGRDKLGQNQRFVPKIQVWQVILQLQRNSLRPTTLRRPTLCQTGTNRSLDRHPWLVQKQGISSMLASQPALSRERLQIPDERSGRLSLLERFHS